MQLTILKYCVTIPKGKKITKKNIQKLENYKKLCTEVIAPIVRR